MMRPVEVENKGKGREKRAFLNASDDRGEVVVLQDHVGRLLAHIRAGNAHGNAEVGLAQGRRIVHAVARHGHNVAAPSARSGGEGMEEEGKGPLAALDDAKLLLGRGASENDLWDVEGGVELVVRHVLELLARDDEGADLILVHLAGRDALLDGDLLARRLGDDADLRGGVRRAR